MANGCLKEKTVSAFSLTQAFSQIEEKLSKLSILVEIISPYFYDPIIIKSHPLNWVIIELIHHVYGQTARYWFDVAKNRYKTISVCEIYRQIRQSKKYKKLSNAQKKSIDDIGKSIEKIKKKYEKRLKKFSDKYYAHNEIRNAKQRRKEYETLKIS